VRLLDAQLYEAEAVQDRSVLSYNQRAVLTLGNHKDLESQHALESESVGW